MTGRVGLKIGQVKRGTLVRAVHIYVVCSSTSNSSCSIYPDDSGMNLSALFHLDHPSLETSA